MKSCPHSQFILYSNLETLETTTALSLNLWLSKIYEHTMQSHNPSTQQPPLTQFSHRHIDTLKRALFSPTIHPPECREYIIGNQLVEIRVTVHIVDIKGLSKVDVCLLQRTTVDLLKFSSRVFLCSWLWDHLSGGVGTAYRWRCVISEGTAIVNLLSDHFTVVVVFRLP